MDELRIVLPEQANSILAAVSGGADSVALLALLKWAAAEAGVRLTAAHFEHGIRAEDSLADAAFVRDLCAEWRIPLIEGSGDVPAFAKAWGMGLEEAAREARYTFLRSAREQAGAQLIALAHHRDDQAETVMMHLFRGSGLGGMTGMKALDGELYRPLLNVRKETLVSFLREKGIPWREDATNRKTDTPRNGLRICVLPEAERFYPGAKQAVCRFAEIAALENDYMEQETDRFLLKSSRRFPGGYLIAREDECVHPAILMRAVHRLTGLSHDPVRRACGLYGKACGRESLSAGWTAEMGGGGLYLLNGGYQGIGEKTLFLKGETDLGELGILKAEKGRGVPVKDQPFCQELDARALEGAVIRTRLPGDVIHPLGAKGRQKLKEYFINRHVDRAVRDCIPLIAKGKDVLWVMGFGISEEAKLKEGAEPVRLELTGWPLQKIGG